MSWSSASGLPSPPVTSSERGASARTFPPLPAAAALCLPTVFPPDHETKNDVQTTEAGGHEGITPAGRREERHRSQQDEAGTHQGDDPDRKSSARHDGRPIEQEPHARKGREQSSLYQRAREQRPDENGRREPQRELLPRPAQ